MSRPLFLGTELSASHVVNSRPMKRDKKDASYDNANYLTRKLDVTPCYHGSRPFTQPGHMVQISAILGRNL